MTSPEAFVWNYIERKLVRSGQESSVTYMDQYLKIQPEKDSNHREEKVLGANENSHHYNIYFRKSDCAVQLNAITGDLLGWFFELDSRDSSQLISDKEALKKAEESIEIPPSAFLESTGYEKMNGQQVFVASWNHLSNGLPVERDYIHVFVNGRTGKVFSLSQRWHDPNFNLTER